MAFITPEETDDRSRKEEKLIPETKEEATGEDSEALSSEEGFGIERRASARHTAKREAHLLFIASLLAMEDQRPPHSLIGYTRDISETGLSLIVTSTHTSDFELCDVGCLLRIKLSLPTGVAEMDARVVRREWLDEADPRRGYFVGVRMEEMSSEDRSRYTEYLRTLG